MHDLNDWCSCVYLGLSMALSSLAVELIGYIIQDLEPADIASLRLVCRELYQKNLYYARRRLFRTVWTILRDPHLAGLKNEKFKVTFEHGGFLEDEIIYCGPRMDVALSTLEKEGKLMSFF
jgi:hypothetical protein